MADDKPESPGRGWHGDADGHAEAGRKGGKTISQDRGHMAVIGRKGGLKVACDPDHMSAIGRKGGAVPKTKAQG